MRRIAALVAVMLTLAVGNASARETHVWVFGDSLSSATISWPAAISATDANPNTPQHEFIAYMKVAAQAGLAYSNLRGEAYFQLPPYLSCRGGPGHPVTKVVLWLGGNDGTYGTPPHAVREHVTTAVRQLQKKGCEFYLVLPPKPEPGFIRYDSWMLVRSIIQDVAEREGVENLLDPYYDWNETLDGLHPNARLSWALGVYFAKQLNL